MKRFHSVPDKRRKSPLIADFTDVDDGKEYRYAYADEHLNSWIALQIKTIREQRGLRQSELAELIGTKQPAIARLENASYSGWKTDTLKKLARALDVRLKISFETFGSLIDEDETFNRKTLERPRFEDDPAFGDELLKAPTDTEALARSGLQSVPSTNAQSAQMALTFERPVAINTLPNAQTRRRELKPRKKRIHNVRKRRAA
jgi:transcriptional regulator with XRE-family HTH domain